MTRERLIGGAVVLGLVLITVLLYVESLNATTTAQIVGYQHTGDPRKIVVIIGIRLADDIAERQVQENATAVQITVHKHTASGTAAGDLVYTPVTIGLREPLGGRSVLDEKGRVVQDFGTYERPTPSPQQPAGP